MRGGKYRFFMIRTKCRRNSVLGFDLAAARRDTSGSINISTSIGIHANNIMNTNINISINANINIIT